ncbi:MAG: T9SS type A sorting domain-containing protein [Bacteroidota bacterium]
MKKFTFLFIFAVLANVFLTVKVSGQISQVTGSPQSSTTTGTTLTITRPSGLAVGDLMIANIVQADNDGADGGDLSNATLAGWTLIAGNQTGIAGSGGDEWWGTLLYRVATAADVSAANFSFTLDGSADDGSGAIAAFRNVNVTGGVNELGAAGGPFDVDPGSTYDNVANDNSLNANAISTVTANAAVVMLGVIGNNLDLSTWSTTTPGSLTEIYDLPFDADLDMGSGSAWALKSATGSTGGGTATISGSTFNGAILIALKPYSYTVNAGPDQLVSGTSVSLSGSTTAGGPTYAWTQTGGPAGPVITTPSASSTTVTGLVSGNTYTFKLTVNGGASDEVSVRVITGTNLWASSSDGTQISSYTVSSGAYGSGPTTMFAPSYPNATNTYTRTAALGRNDKPAQTSGYFYWLGTSDGGNENNGLVEVFAASAAGGSPTRIGSIDLNGGSGAELGFVRLGIGPDGTGWILAGDGTTLYLASFMSNGVNSVTITIVDASVSLTGGTVPTFVNGDLCLNSGGSIFALANNGSGVTQIFIGAPAGASTTLVKKWDLVDPSNVPFTGSVNGVAFDLLGALYISTSDGLYYINPATVNGPAGTVQCSLVDAQTGLQDLASNVFPTTILLPVKLGAFTVTKQGNNALLNWTTVSEISTDHFEIERSYDGVNFVSVGTTSAAGNSASDINYSFTDPITVNSGIIYYRLKTLDIDGKESFSKIVSLRLNGGVVKNFTVYPNPFSSDLKVELNADKETEITIRISNAAGQQVINRRSLLQKGNNVVVLSSELSAMQKGMYVLEIISEDGKMSQKIIKR